MKSDKRFMKARINPDKLESERKAAFVSVEITPSSEIQGYNSSPTSGKELILAALADMEDQMTPGAAPTSQSY